MRWIGRHPVPAGTLGGFFVVAVAAAAAPGGIVAAPLEAGVLSLMVVFAWTVLIYFMRDFFARQALREAVDRYRLEADDERFELQKNDETAVGIDEPSYELYLPPDVEPSEERPQNATRVWLAVRGDGAAYVVETQVTSDEARQYPRPDDIDGADDHLPIHLASGLLQLADRAEQRERDGGAAGG